MNKSLQSLAIGVTLGAVSWIVVPLVSNKVEPYDSSAAFFIGQLLMVCAASYYGFAFGVTTVIPFILGAYAGLNLFPYVFGSSEQRAWAGLGLIASSFLCVLPLLAGLGGALARYLKAKYNNSVKRDAAKPPTFAER